MAQFESRAAAQAADPETGAPAVPECLWLVDCQVSAEPAGRDSTRYLGRPGDGGHAVQRHQRVAGRNTPPCAPDKRETYWKGTSA